jgi:hypothetical protein
VVSEYASILKAYGLHSVTGDRYSAEWCASSFRENDIFYETATKPKSEIYLETLPLWATGQVRIPDAKVTIAELRGLERRVGRSGRDSVDHPQSGHDDHANALCGCLWLLAEAPVEITSDMFWTADEETLGGQLMQLASEGVSPSEARLMVSRPTRPWDVETDTSRPGPFIV